VVAAAVRLGRDTLPDGLRDSKALSPARRRALAQCCPDHAIGAASVAEIDRLNIHHATLLAMARAIAALAHRCGPPTLILVDGLFCPSTGWPARAVPGGDASCASIAAASIVAKAFRDALMDRLAQECPGYGWERNRGYPTAEHRTALARLGPTAHHRRSFAPVRALAV
jgi:ribonuclease HII